MEYAGAVITLGGSMTNLLHDNKYLLDSFDDFEALIDDDFIVRKKSSNVRLVGTNCGWKRLSEAMGTLKDCKAYVGVGFVGAFDSGTNPGEIIIPDYAESSPEIPYNSGRPEQNLLESLSKYSIKSFQKLRKGKVYTINSILEEDAELISMLRSEGFLGIDMESSFLFAHSEHLKKPAAAILIVSDNEVTYPLEKTECSGRDLVITEESEYNARLAIKIAAEALLEQSHS